MRVTVHKMGRRESDLCLRGCGQRGTLFHTIWECPLVRRYWERVGERISGVLAVQLHLTPQLVTYDI